MRFKQYDQDTTPNQGADIVPTLIVIHYTAGGENSVDWLKNPSSKASAHFVITRAGKVTQLVDTKLKAWHAGRSEWNGMRACNNFSIGIELENWGNAKDPEFENYTDVQIAACFKLCKELMAHHKTIKEIVGHSDIAPRRKIDPGPKFPWKEFEHLQKRLS